MGRYLHHLWDPLDNLNEANDFQANYNILVPEGNPYGSYLAGTSYDLGPQIYAPANVLTPGPAPYATTPYDPRLQAYPPADVFAQGMAPYATMPYSPHLQAYPPANILTPGLALHTTPYETEPPFAQDHAFAPMTTMTMTTTTTPPLPSAFPASAKNPNSENNSSNSSTAGNNNKASKPRSLCMTCGRDFSRTSDMQRHAKKHGVAKYFQCSVVGCKYAGSYRKDKLEQHVRNVH